MKTLQEMILEVVNHISTIPNCKIEYNYDASTAYEVVATALVTRYPIYTLHKQVKRFITRRYMLAERESKLYTPYSITIDELNESCHDVLDAISEEFSEAMLRYRIEYKLFRCRTQADCDELTRELFVEYYTKRVVDFYRTLMNGNTFAVDVIKNIKRTKE
jgi:hypothetical protein